MYKLYYSPGSCSMAVHILLNEIDAPVSLEKIAVSEGQNRSPEFLKINPRGQVPVLMDDETVLREGAAILLYLCEKHNSPLLPSQGAARSAAIEWLMFCNASLHTAYGRGFFLMKNTTDEAAKAHLLSITVAQINKLWEEVEGRLEDNQYIAGNEITVADILLTVIANWSGRFQGIKIGSRAKQLFSRVIERPSYVKALSVENVEYKAAA